MSDLSDEIEIFFNDKDTVLKYSKEEIYSVLSEYHSAKDYTIPSMFKPEYYEDINKFMAEVSTMTQKQKKILSEFLIKKLKYMER